jgi:cobalt-zinc-cadmium efflux system protein
MARQAYRGRCSGADSEGRDGDGRDNGGMSQEARVGLVLGINLAMVLALLLVGFFAHSLGVLASGADYLGDAFGAGLALLGLRLSRRRVDKRASSFAALVNASLLLIVTLAVIVEAIYRLSTWAPSIHGVPVVVVSVIAAGAMVTCALILGDVGSDLGMQSVMLDSIADAAAALGVAISGGVILLTGGTYWLDSLVALVIALVVAFHAIKLLREVVLELH